MSFLLQGKGGRLLDLCAVPHEGCIGKDCVCVCVCVFVCGYLPLQSPRP